MQADFLIIGASLSGCTLAMKLKALGYAVVLVEQEFAPREHFKGEYLQPFAVKFLREAGLGAALRAANPIHALRFRDLGTENSHVISEGLIAYPESEAALAIPHLELIQGLREILRENLKENFFEGASVEPLNLSSSTFLSAPEFLLKARDGSPHTLKPRIVVGCDGRQSKTRSWVQGPKPFRIAQTVVGAPSEFIVGCEIKNTLLNPHEYQVIRSDRDSTISIFALNEKHCRVYWNAPTGLSDQFGSNPRTVWTKKLELLFKDIYRATGLRAENPVKASGCPAFTSWYGPSFRGKFFLAGDSLAVTTPFGGQGMTSGTLHAEALAQLFQYGIPSNDGVLETLGRRYEKRAQTIFAHFNLLNTGLYHLFFSRNRAFKLATRHILKTWAANPELTSRMGRLFGALDRDTPEVNELLKLWGIPKPNIYPLNSANLYIEIQRWLVPLMHFSNQAGKAIGEGTRPFSRVRQRIRDIRPITKFFSAKPGETEDLS